MKTCYKLFLSNSQNLFLKIYTLRYFLNRELELQKNLWEEKAQLMLSEMDKNK